jgi:uncharacterized protein (TIGR04255 family)
MKVLDKTTGAYFMIKPMLRRKYKKPAIQEAIFEAKFTYDSDNFGVTTPGEIFEKIKVNYPKKQNIKHIPIFLDNPDNTQQPPFLIQAPLIQAKKADDSELLQLGPGIAVANRLKYTSWEDFIPGIQTILDAYICTAQPNAVTRIGTRYINCFLIPQSAHITDYFNLGIQIPTTLSNLEGFDLTFVNKIKSVDDQSTPNFNIRTRFFTDTLMPGETGNKLILDIDCYVTKEFTPDAKKMIYLATQAHDMLETIFENIITDKTRNLMEVEECIAH